MVSFVNGPGDFGSISGRIISTTQKMVLDAALLNTQHYKVRIKGKVEQLNTYVGDQSKQLNTYVGDHLVTAGTASHPWPVCYL